MAHVVHIGFQPLDRDYEDRMGDYIRVPVDSALLVAGHGIRGDRKAGRNQTRQVNLIAREWLAARAEEGYRAAPGQFGEQIVIGGLAVETLPPETLLAIGEEVVLAVSKGRTGCERLEAAQGKSIAGLGPIGVLTRVVHGGRIYVGDEVRVLQPAEAQANG
ncbi:MAG TPA: MOSC domain-containing protein [Promineifilum sp.]|nr:MOSC domain-containing protein [Promineifilum sp.]